MTTLATYSDLIAELPLWLERDDLTARLPSFIALAEAKMNRVLRTNGAEGRSTASITTEFSDLPADFREAKAVRVYTAGVWTSVDPVSGDAIDAEVTLTGTPRFYAVLGDQLRLYPSPSSALTVELTYFKKVPALTLAAPTNWVLTDHPDAYLYGALTHSAPFLIDLTMLPVWKGMSDTALGEMLNERRRPGGKLRTDPALTDCRTFNINTGV